MEKHRVYRGSYQCPKCGSRENGADVVATSKRWIDFTCDCGHLFRKSAVNVSGLSRRLARLAKTID